MCFYDREGDLKSYMSVNAESGKRNLDETFSTGELICRDSGQQKESRK